MTLVIEIVEALIAAGDSGLPNNWRDDFHSPFPGWDLAGHVYNMRGSEQVRYAARAVSRSIRFDFCRDGAAEAPELDALKSEHARVRRLLTAAGGVSGSR